jgi:hypothetical protein
MSNSLIESMPRLQALPLTLPREGSITLELEQGVAIFRTSPAVVVRIEGLLDKQRNAKLSQEEESELDQYEEIDDYLSFINRLLRNISHEQQATGESLP